MGEGGRLLRPGLVPLPLGQSLPSMTVGTLRGRMREADRGPLEGSARAPPQASAGVSRCRGTRGSRVYGCE